MSKKRNSSELDRSNCKNPQSNHLWDLKFSFIRSIRNLKVMAWILNTLEALRTLSSLIGRIGLCSLGEVAGLSNPGAAQLFEIRLSAGLWLLKLVSGPLDLSCCVLHASVNWEMLKNYRQEPSNLFSVFLCVGNNWAQWITFQYSTRLFLLLLSAFYLLFKLLCLFWKHKALFLCFLFGARQCRMSHGIKLKGMYYPI